MTELSVFYIITRYFRINKTVICRSNIISRNIFSSLPTAIEKYGQAYIEAEVQKSSTFLDENIYKFN